MSISSKFIKIVTFIESEKIRNLLLKIFVWIKGKNYHFFVKFWKNCVRRQTTYKSLRNYQSNIILKCVLKLEPFSVIFFSHDKGCTKQVCNILGDDLWKVSQHASCNWIFLKFPKIVEISLQMLQHKLHEAVVWAILL